MPAGSRSAADAAHAGASWRTGLSARPAARRPRWSRRCQPILAAGRYPRHECQRRGGPCSPERTTASEASPRLWTPCSRCWRSNFRPDRWHSPSSIATTMSTGWSDRARRRGPFFEAARLSRRRPRLPSSSRSRSGVTWRCPSRPRTGARSAQLIALAREPGAYGGRPCRAADGGGASALARVGERECAGRAPAPPGGRARRGDERPVSGLPNRIDLPRLARACLAPGAAGTVASHLVVIELANLPEIGEIAGRGRGHPAAQGLCRGAGGHGPPDRPRRPRREHAPGGDPGRMQGRRRCPRLSSTRFRHALEGSPRLGPQGPSISSGFCPWPASGQPEEALRTRRGAGRRGASAATGPRRRRGRRSRHMNVATRERRRIPGPHQLRAARASRRPRIALAARASSATSSSNSGSWIARPSRNAVSEARRSGRACHAS